MNKLKELIDKLCPNGVEFKKIEELTSFEQPTKYIVKSTKYDDSYKTPVLTAGQTFILGYTNENDGIYNASKENPVIIFDDFTGAYKWVDFPFKVKSSAMKIITANEDKVLIRFLYHVMGFLNFTSDEHKRLWISIYSQMKIAVPPLEVQCEIVHILDDFTLLSTELSTKLSAELKARQKQYEYYRDELINTNYEKVVKLKDLCVIKGRIGFRGYTRNDLVEKGNGAISFSPGNIINGTINYNNCTYISWEKYEESPEIMINDGDIIFCKTGSTLGKVAMVEKLPEKATLNPQLVVLRDVKCNPVYLKYILGGYYFQSAVQSKKGLGSVPNISQKDIGDIEIKLHNQVQQNKIADILSSLDKICNSLSNGLPVEIEKRQKQYEYYRDKLLSFKEVDVNE